MFNIVLALLGSTISSVGIVLQKKGLLWTDYRKNKRPGFLALFATWLLGIFLAYFISAIPIGLASKVLPPHIITSMSGWGIVVILFLSYFILKERIYSSDILYSLIIVGSTLAIGLLSNTSATEDVDRIRLVLIFGAPFLILIPAFIKALNTKIRASLFATFAGIMGGVAIVFLGILVRQYFSNGFPELSKDILAFYLVAAITGALAEQVSYKLGQMTLVASIRLGSFIIYPVLCSILLFRSRVDVLQILSIVLIVFSCYGIFKKR